MFYILSLFSTPMKKTFIASIKELIHPMRFLFDSCLFEEFELLLNKFAELLIWSNHLKTSHQTYYYCSSITFASNAKPKSSIPQQHLDGIGNIQMFYRLSLFSTFIEKKPSSPLSKNRYIQYVFCWLCLSLTHSLTHSLPNWLPFSKLDWYDPGVSRWQLKTCWDCYCC